MHSLDDLNRDELLCIAKRCLVSQRDIWWARWVVAEERVIAADRAHLEALHKTPQFPGYGTRAFPKWSKADDNCTRALDESQKLHAIADKIYAENQTPDTEKPE